MPTTPLRPRATCCSARRAAGFTLIELVIVLTLVGMLVALATPRYFHVIDQGRDKVQRQNLSTLRDAIDKFFGDLGRYPDSLDELVSRRYLREVPIDPVTDSKNWSIVAPSDPSLGAVYDVVSAAAPAPSASAANP
jgi:general secretion pathway protein G